MKVNSHFGTLRCRFKKGASPYHHCVYQTHYHIVFPVKYRKSLLDKEISEGIKGIAREIGERYEIEFEQIGCDENHIHILCSFHPKYSIGEIVRKFKSITARELFKRHPRLRRELWGGNFGRMAIT